MRASARSSIHLPRHRCHAQRSAPACHAPFFMWHNKTTFNFRLWAIPSGGGRRVAGAALRGSCSPSAPSPLSASACASGRMARPLPGSLKLLLCIAAFTGQIVDDRWSCEAARIHEHAEAEGSDGRERRGQEESEKRGLTWLSYVRLGSIWKTQSPWKR